MTQSETYGWGVAILMSLLLHSVMFLKGGAKLGATDSSVLTAPTVTRLNFNPAITKRMQEREHQVEQKKIGPVKKIKTEPIASKKVIPLIEPVAVVEPLRQPDIAQQVRGEQVNHSSDGMLEQKRQQFLRELMRHIESFKYYPRVARKRAIEGGVKISFVLRPDGFYEQLKMDGVETSLVNATLVTLESALPLPLPPEEINLSVRVEFIMMYSLTD